MNVQNDTSEEVEYQVGMTGCKRLAVGQRLPDPEIGDGSPRSDEISVYRACDRSPPHKCDCPDQDKRIGCCKITKVARGTVIHIRGSHSNIRFRASSPDVNLLSCP